MQIYLVGGAVRDELLQLPVKERDWVVVGAQPKDLLEQGYKQVGKDFPVFLHPKTQEEYALARTEKKHGHGYKGFSVCADPSITLEQDLLRRDLTINAMAKSNAGELIDPYHGRNDLKQGLLKHVSPAFAEDPLRVVRLARFAAKLPDFIVAETTIELCQQLVQSGELEHLTKERVWAEWMKTFALPAPWRFVEVLVQVGAWEKLMPGCDNAELVVKRLQQSSATIKDEKLFILTGLVCPQKAWHQHLKAMAIPKQLYEACVLAGPIYTALEQHQTSQAQLLDCFYQWDVFRRPERFKAILAVLASIMPQDKLINRWLAWLEKLHKIRPNKEVIARHQGEALAKWLYQQRLAAMTEQS